jgi:transposase-like protein
MACYQKVTCPHCGSDHIIKFGTSPKGEQRYRCQNSDCTTTTFMQAYCYKAYEPGMKARIVDMAINGSGIRDTARVLKVSLNTVIATLKKKPPASLWSTRIFASAIPRRTPQSG